MAKSLNQVTLMGNLTSDPELRDTPNGQSVVNCSIALNRSYKDANEQWQEATDYVDIVVWGRTAEQLSASTQKGSKILISGRLASRTWEKDGQKFNKLEVVAQDITFIDKIIQGDN